MGTATRVGQAGLQGWREKVADGIARPISARTPLNEDQARALIGSVFFTLSVVYVAKTLRSAAGHA